MGNVPLAIPVHELGIEELERAQMLARRYHAEFVDLKNFKIQHDLFKRVPVDMMFRYNFVPLEQVGSRLAIAVSRSVEADGLWTRSPACWEHVSRHASQRCLRSPSY